MNLSSSSDNPKGSMAAAPIIQAKDIPILARLAVTIVMLFKGASMARYLSTFTASNEIVDIVAQYPFVMLVAKHSLDNTKNGNNVFRAEDRERGRVQESPINKSALVSDIKKSFVG